MKNPYSRLPTNGIVVDDELFDASTGEPWVVDAGCNCDEGHLCTAIACQEQSFVDHDEAEAEFGRAPRQPSREDWNQAYADRPSKRDAYDRTFGPEL